MRRTSSRYNAVAKTRGLIRCYGSSFFLRGLCSDVIGEINKMRRADWGGKPTSESEEEARVDSPSKEKKKKTEPKPAQSLKLTAKIKVSPRRGVEKDSESVCKF